MDVDIDKYKMCNSHLISHDGIVLSLPDYLNAPGKIIDFMREWEDERMREWEMNGWETMKKTKEFYSKRIEEYI